MSNLFNDISMGHLSIKDTLSSCGIYEVNEAASEIENRPEIKYLFDSICENDLAWCAGNERLLSSLFGRMKRGEELKIGQGRKIWDFEQQQIVTDLYGKNLKDKTKTLAKSFKTLSLKFLIKNNEEYFLSEEGFEVIVALVRDEILPAKSSRPGWLGVLEEVLNSLPIPKKSKLISMILQHEEKHGLNLIQHALDYGKESIILMCLDHPDSHEIRKKIFCQEFFSRGIFRGEEYGIEGIKILMRNYGEEVSLVLNEEVSEGKPSRIFRTLFLLIIDKHDLEALELFYTLAEEKLLEVCYNPLNSQETALTHAAKTGSEALVDQILDRAPPNYYARQFLEGRRNETPGWQRLGTNQIKTAIRVLERAPAEAIRSLVTKGKSDETTPLLDLLLFKKDWSDDKERLIQLLLIKCPENTYEELFKGDPLSTALAIKDYNSAYALVAYCPLAAFSTLIKNQSWKEHLNFSRMEANWNNANGEYLSSNREKTTLQKEIFLNEIKLL